MKKGVQNLEMTETVSYNLVIIEQWELVNQWVIGTLRNLHLENTENEIMI